MNSSSLSWICRTRSATKIHKCMYYSYPEKTNFSRTRVPTYYLQNVCPFSVNLRPQRSFMSRFIIIRGLPYMTSAVGGGRGVPKKQKKGTKSAELWQWQGGRGSKNPKMLRTSYMEAPKKQEKDKVGVEKNVHNFNVAYMIRMHAPWKVARTELSLNRTNGHWFDAANMPWKCKIKWSVERELEWAGEKWSLVGDNISIIGMVWREREESWMFVEKVADKRSLHG